LAHDDVERQRTAHFWRWAFVVAVALFAFAWIWTLVTDRFTWLPPVVGIPIALLLLSPLARRWLADR
jgi:hypothetical protein